MGNPLVLIVLSLCLTSLFITMLIVPEADDDIEIMTVDSLDRHNFYRKRHNVSNLIINDEISKVSQDWANELAKKNKFMHRPNGIYGENLYWCTSTKKDNRPYGNMAVDAFYDEIKYFDFYGSEEKMTASKKAFHLTQVLWKGSKELGQAASRSLKTGNVYVVCNYDPRGNHLRKFKKNVFPPNNT